MIRPISAGELKHIGLIKTANSYTATGQPTGWQSLCAPYFGIDNEVVSQADEDNNTGNKKTLALFTRYDDRIQNGQAVFIFGTLYLISALDNVEFANIRLNFTATEL